MASLIASPANQTSLLISGMTCASCAGRVEKALAKVDGVASATVNLALERATVTRTKNVSITDLIAAVQRAGYEASPIPDTPTSDDDQAASPTPILIAALLTAPLLLSMLLGMHDHAWMLSGYWQWLLASVVQFVFGMRFYRNGFNAIRAGSANMDVLVAIGTSAAYGLSTYLLLTNPDPMQHLYFETSTTVLTLVMVGKWLEQRARRQGASAIRALLALQPDTAVVRTNGIDVSRPLDSVNIGDVVIVLAGARIPVDGEVIEGQGQVDESMVTGESLPRTRTVGDHVIGGSFNLDGRLCIRTSAVGATSTLARIIALVDSAQTGKAPIQRHVDRISAIFVPLILVLAVMTFMGWGLTTGGWQSALLKAVAILVVACPCAMGLATPMAIMVGTGVAARNGILIRDVQWLEQAHRIDTIAFDKTGTLTAGKPVMRHMLALGDPVGDESGALQLAASLQAASSHPLALALTGQASQRSLTLRALTDFKSVAGCGVQGRVDGHLFAIASEAWMRTLHCETPPAVLAQISAWRTEGLTVSWLLDLEPTPRLLAGFAFGDALKPTAGAAIHQLQKMGLRIVLISGDNPACVNLVAQQLGIDDAHAEVLPGQKAELIAQLQREGRKVGMVGDGINDAPALAIADIGIAMANGTDIAMETAGITLMRGDPLLVGAAIEISTRTCGKIRQNLFWAFAYNLIGIPLAASGMLDPIWCGAAMAFSSVSVMANALLLLRWKSTDQAGLGG